ncbi:MAG: hypothetical protein WC045_01745 [Patescibacteria group bacterium]
MRKTILSFILVSILCSGIYITGQQVLRRSANSPQEEIASQIAAQLAGDKKIDKFMPNTSVDIATSPDTFIMLYNDNQEMTISSTLLNGSAPRLPKDILNYAKDHTENKLTWEPVPGVRTALIVKRIEGKNPGYVAVGRSLTGTERNTLYLGLLMLTIWLVSLPTLIFLYKRKKK